MPLTWLRGQLAILGTYLPLGTFLAMGAAVANVFGEPIMTWYLGFLV